MPRKRAQGTRAPNGASSIYLGKDGSWHGRVTVGVLDDGKPDRRHIKRKTEGEVITAVRELERQRGTGKIRGPGRPWTVTEWLSHWVDCIAAPAVRPNTLVGYRVAVRNHLIPGIGAHRIDKLQPEHLERFYVALGEKLTRDGTPFKPARIHQVHRTRSHRSGRSRAGITSQPTQRLSPGRRGYRRRRSCPSLKKKQRGS